MPTDKNKASKPHKVAKHPDDKETFGVTRTYVVTLTYLDSIELDAYGLTDLTIADAATREADVGNVEGTLRVTNHGNVLGQYMMPHEDEDEFVVGEVHYIAEEKDVTC